MMKINLIRSNIRNTTFVFSEEITKDDSDALAEAAEQKYDGGRGAAGERGCEATDYLREASVYKGQELSP